MKAIAATAFILLIGFNETTEAQVPGAGEGEARHLQAGPTLGTSIYREVTVEYGLQVGLRRGSWLWDATLTGFTSRFRLPPVSHQSFEGLAGFGWYPGSGTVSAGAGGRIGIAYTANFQGERKPRPVAGPIWAWMSGWVEPSCCTPRRARTSTSRTSAPAVRAVT